MPRTDVTFDRFLRAVHRRQVALRIVERAGVGLVIACAVATALVAVVIWRGGDDAWSLAGFALVAGVVVGAVAGAVRRPSALDAAGEADRQLQTADLLATALSLRAQSDTTTNDPWADTVLALAAERCRRHAPREVVLRRLGVRAWGGIVLAVAFVGVLTALSSASREAVAGHVPGSDAAAGARDASRANQRPIVELTDVTPTPPRQRRTELSPEDAASSSTTDASTTPDQKTAAADTQPDRPDARDAGATGPDAPSPGVGASQATSANPRTTARPSPSAEAGEIERPTPPPRDDGSPRAGVGRAAPSNHDGTDAAQGGVISHTDGSVSTPVAPWSSNTWRQTVESAEQQVRSGRVPDDARDLVRGYFDPAASGR